VAADCSNAPLRAFCATWIDVATWQLVTHQYCPTGICVTIPYRWGGLGSWRSSRIIAHCAPPPRWQPHWAAAIQGLEPERSPGIAVHPDSEVRGQVL